jgi:hypothetical protein
MFKAFANLQASTERVLQEAYESVGRIDKRLTDNVGADLEL